MSHVLALFGVFAPLSLVTVGGGQSVIADIQRQVVAEHHWLTTSQFLDAFAISRMAPGPGSLLATLIGWKVAGPMGAAAATIGIFGPTAILIYAITRLWSRHHGSRWQLAFEAGLGPIAAGLILASVFVVIQGLEGGWPARVISLLATVVLMRSRLSPLIVIAGGAGVFAVISAL